MDTIQEEAVRYFGLTKNYRTAGYILTDGSMLDFSGAHWLDRDFYSDGEIQAWKKQNQVRQADHEDIAEVVMKYDDSISDNRKYFMKLGAIRVSPEAPGFNVLTDIEPTSDQYRALKGFIEDIMDDPYFSPNSLFVDLEEKYPDKIVYPLPIKAERIINDLKNFYKTGTRPQPSFLMSACI